MKYLITGGTGQLGHDIVKELIKSKDENFKFNKMNLYFENKAYNTFLDYLRSLEDK